MSDEATIFERDGDLWVRIGPRSVRLTVLSERDPQRGNAVPLLGGVNISGSWRVYFHRLNPDGLPWCVAPDAGGWEIAVRNVAIDVPCRAAYYPKAMPDDEDGRPSAWIAVTGTLTVSEDGMARIA